MKPFDALDLNPTTGKLRTFGIVACVVFACLAFSLERGMYPFRHDLGAARAGLTWLLAALSVSSGLFALITPRLNRFLFVALSLLTFPIHFVVGHILMAALFFGLIAPLAAFQRLLGRDALRLRGSRRPDSYWTTASPARPAADYFRQY
jgi:hypothetical protein